MSIAWEETADDKQQVQRPWGSKAHVPEGLVQMDKRKHNIKWVGRESRVQVLEVQNKKLTFYSKSNGKTCKNHKQKSDMI